MTRDEIFPAKYLKASDLNGKPIAVTIENAPVETLKNAEGKEQTKVVLYFRGAKKALPLNVTNFDACADACGADTDDWPGHTIELYPAKTQMAGKTVDCIRIRPPAQRTLPASKPKASAVAQPALAEEMNDDIPF